MSGKARTFLFSGKRLMAMSPAINRIMNEEEKSKCLFVHVGEMVAEVMYEQHVSKHEFADRIGTDRSNVYRIVRKQSLETDQLYRYSKELNHNFFRDLAEEFERRKKRNEQKS